MVAPPVSGSSTTPLQKIQRLPRLSLSRTPTRGRTSSSTPRLLASPPLHPRRDPNPRTRNSRGGRRYSQFPDISHRFPANLDSPLPLLPAVPSPVPFFRDFLVLFLVVSFRSARPRRIRGGWASVLASR